MKIKASDSCPCGSGKTFGECHDKLRRERRTADTELIHVPLAVIAPPDPATRAIFERSANTVGAFFTGISGPHTLECGTCSAELATRVHRQRFGGIVLRCYRCGAYNET